MQLDLSYVDREQEAAFAASRVQYCARDQRRYYVVQMLAAGIFAVKHACCRTDAATLNCAMVFSITAIQYIFTSSHNIRCDHVLLVAAKALARQSLSHDAPDCRPYSLQAALCRVGAGRYPGHPAGLPHVPLLVP